MCLVWCLYLSNIRKTYTADDEQTIKHQAMVWFRGAMYIAYININGQFHMWRRLETCCPCLHEEGLQKTEDTFWSWVCVFWSLHLLGAVGPLVQWFWVVFYTSSTVGHREVESMFQAWVCSAQRSKGKTVNKARPDHGWLCLLCYGGRQVACLPGCT